MTVYVHIRGTGVVLQVPQNKANPARNGLISWVDHMELNYNMTLCYKHILYLYCIHHHLV
jgi:hypothetical protein